MNQVIYADVLFFIDMSMDFLALYVTAYLLKFKFKTRRLALASLIGALYSVTSVILRSDSIYYTVLIAVAMCLFAYGKCAINQFFGRIVSFFAVNMLLGGGMTAVFNLFSRIDGVQKVVIYGQVHEVSSQMPFGVYLVGFSAISLIVFGFGKLFNKKGVARHRVLTIYYGGKRSVHDVIEDSGNMLCEPMSGDPVVFLTENAVRRAFGDGMVSCLDSPSSRAMLSERGKMRIVVYETVAGRDMSVCVRADKAYVGGTEYRLWFALGRAFTANGSDGIVPALENGSRKGTWR